MLNITNITLKNFLSIGNVTQAVKLNINGLTLVLGSNIDANGGNARNGTGKSTILQGLSYGLYGKPLTKIRLPNLVNNINTKNMVITLEFDREGKNYRIERGQKPTFLKFFVDNHEMKDDEDSAQGESKHTQEEINRIIGMSHNLFKHLIALNTFTDPFLKETVSSQREIIEELLGVMQISDRAEILKKLITSTKDDIRDYEAHVKATTEANSRIQRAIEQAENSLQKWIQYNDRAIAELITEIDTINGINYEDALLSFDALDAYIQNEISIKSDMDFIRKDSNIINQTIQGFLKEKEIYIKELQGNAVDSQILRHKSDIERKKNDMERHMTNIIQLKTEMSKLDHDIHHSDEQACICCGQSLTGTVHLKTVLANLQKQHDIASQKHAFEEQSIKDRENEISNLLELIEDIRISSDLKKTDLESKIKKLKGQISEKITEIENFDTKIKEYEDKLTSLGVRPVVMFKSRDEVYRAKQMFDTLTRDLEQEKTKINPYLNQVQTLVETLQIIEYGPLNDLSDLLKHQEFLLKLLTSKDSFIRKRIIDQNLSYLNNRLNQYLEKLGLPHEVKFLSDLSVEITLLGREFDYEQLSRGEMNRVNMATSWAFRDIWESLNFGINLLWVDELLDQGTDTAGVEAALTVLKGFARERKKNVFLISHREELVSRIDTILLVKKIEDFTEFEEDPVLIR